MYQQTSEPPTVPPQTESLGARPHLDERAEYGTPRGRVEHFMVPLLTRAIPEAIRQFAHDPPAGSAALDAGCGRQPLRKMLESAGYRYIGLDTQQNQDDTVDVVAPIDGPLRDDLLRMGPFRFILCTEVLEHVADWDAAFANFARLLTPGGRVLVTCPHFYQLHEEPYDFWRPTPHAVKFYAARHGLRVIEERKLGDAWDLLGTALANIVAAPRRRGVVCGVVTFAARALKKIVFTAIDSRVPQRWITLRGPLFISTLAVLEKP